MKHFHHSLVFLSLLCLLGLGSHARAGACVPASVSTVTLTVAGDNYYQAFINGSLIGSCTAKNCYGTPAVYTVSPALISLPPADNVIGIFGSDSGGGFASGTGWHLNITYVGCPAQDLYSDNTCTKTDDAGIWTGSFPASGWSATGFNDSSWVGGWAGNKDLCGAPCGGTPNPAWDTADVMPPTWIWGTNTFVCTTGGQGYYFRQYFKAGDPSYCPFAALPTATPVGGGPTNTYTSTRTRTPTRTPTPTLSGTSTATGTLTPSPTLTASPTLSSTPTASPSPTRTGTPSPSPTQTSSPTRTGTPTTSASPTLTCTYTASLTPSNSPTQTATRTQTSTYTASLTPTDTPTQTDTATLTSTYTASLTPSNSPTQTATHTQTSTYSASLTPSDTPTQTNTQTQTPSSTESPVASPTSTSTATDTSSVTPTFTATPTDSFTSTETPTFSASPSDTDTATETPGVSATDTPTSSETPTETPTSSATPTSTSTSSETPTLTESPTASVSPSITETFTPAPTFTPQPPVAAKVQIFNSAGELVVTLYESLPLYQEITGVSAPNSAFVPDEGGQGTLNLTGPGMVIAWDGKNAAGQLVGGGVYNMVVEMHDGFGKQVIWNVPQTVLRSDSGAEIQVYNSAGELVWHTQAPLQAAGAMSLSQRELVPEGGGNIKINYGSGPTDYVYWNGLGDQGQALASGSYLVKVTQSGSSGKSSYADTVTLLEPSGGVFAWVAAAPNPVPAGSSSVMISLQGASAGLSAWGEAYNLAGEHVGTLPMVSGSFLQWDIPSGLASGVYLLQVNARDGQGRLKSATVKLSILR